MNHPSGVWVYVMGWANRTMKIGISSNPKLRMAQLKPDWCHFVTSGSGVFAYGVERATLRLLADFRINPRSECFRGLDKAAAINAVRSVVEHYRTVPGTPANRNEFRLAVDSYSA